MGTAAGRAGPGARADAVSTGIRGAAFIAGAYEHPERNIPFNTDGGRPCSSHPGNRGGLAKVLEAVRQLRGKAHPLAEGPRVMTNLVDADAGAARIGDPVEVTFHDTGQGAARPRFRPAGR